tara:strand:- start:1112 stop:1315 length:204 start_codon:yes stop_codon:yes gene_type:complete
MSNSDTLAPYEIKRRGNGLPFFFQLVDTRTGQALTDEVEGYSPIPPAWLRAKQATFNSDHLFAEIGV